MRSFNPLSQAIALSLLACGKASIAADAPAEGGASAPPVQNLTSKTYSGLIELEIGSSKKTASGEIRYGFDDNFWVVTLTGPFDEDEGEVLLGDLDRLGNSTSVELAYRREWADKGVSLRVGGRTARPNYKYLDLASNVVSTVRKEAQEVLVRGEKFVPVGGGLNLSLTYKSGTAFEAASVRNICTPVSGVNATECRNLATAAPERVNTSIAIGEIAYMPNKKIGFGLALARDFEEDITGIELPIYLKRDEESGLLAGGVKLSWQSDTDEVECLLFLSQPIGD